jgi:hypothetical protein
MITLVSYCRSPPPLTAIGGEMRDIIIRGGVSGFEAEHPE